jgi:hypothetical protein
MPGNGHVPGHRAVAQHGQDRRTVGDGDLQLPRKKRARADILYGHHPLTSNNTGSMISSKLL